MITTESNATAGAITIRMGKALRRQVEAAAKAAVRTLNGEVIFRLQGTFEPQRSNKRADAGA